MAFDIMKIFEGVEPLSKISEKKVYEGKMNMFLSDRYGYLKELVEAADVATASKIFCNDVHVAFDKFGKARMGNFTNLNMFLIIFVFPAIIKNEGERAPEICDALKNAWNSRFKCNIDYTDYDSIMDSFQNRILGFKKDSRWLDF